jgi:hypothetical protein
MTCPAKPNVVIFCDHLLYPSETFIHAQAHALSDFEPTFAGTRRVAGLDLREEQVRVINRGNISGKLQELGFKLFGLAPGLVRELNALKPVLLHAHYGPNGLRALPLANNLHVRLTLSENPFGLPLLSCQEGTIADEQGFVSRCVQFHPQKASGTRVSRRAGHRPVHGSRYEKISTGNDRMLPHDSVCRPIGRIERR